MSDFRAFVESLGIRPRSVAPDGRWRRCPTVDKPRSRNGSYKLALDGRIGWAQNFATMTEPATWRAAGAVDVPAFDPARLDVARAEAQRQRVAATRAAREFYAACAPLIGGHAYLDAHGLDMTGCRGLRVDRDGWMVVPAFVAGEISSVQRISPDGVKRFWPGASMRGASYTIDRQRACTSVLVEGLATGLAIFAAVPTTRVIVAFNAGNLSTVAATMPTGPAVIAADNDWGTEARTGANPGIRAAQAAAEMIGCGVAVPEDLVGTDWSDWRQEMVAARLAMKRPRERESDIQRAVDALIASTIGKNTMFVSKGRS
jgi:putative DNA primase/helicase